MKYLIIAMVVLASSSAWGACRKGDIAGIHLLYSDSGGLVAVCAIGVNRRGRVLPGSNCAAGARLSGRLRVRNDCIVRGTLRFSGGAFFVLGSMEKDKNTITGVFGDDTAAFMFTAVKHDRFAGTAAALLSERTDRPSTNTDSLELIFGE